MVLAVQSWTLIDRYWREAIRRHRMMARAEQVRTYISIAVAIVCFVGCVAVIINLLLEPKINRGDVGALIAALGGFLTATSLLWIRYAQKPPTR
jgi:H+/Cl- antiporter ClcA